ncbi:MAG TPA: hypothetical protein PKK12_11275 [Candidatus Aminicenantes bacterium]|nr:hypothetical protein [Candidatus Aminicenantes bacterium]
MRRWLCLLSLLFLGGIPAVAGTAEPEGPATGRNLVVVFDLRDPSGGGEAAVEYLFGRLLRPGDRLIIRSPQRFYSFSAATLAGPRGKLIDDMKEKLRSDISRASQDYRQAIEEMTGIVRGIENNVIGTVSDSESASLRSLFMRYGQCLSLLRQIGRTSSASLREMADFFGDRSGRHHVIMVVERKTRPVPNRDTMNLLKDSPIFMMQANALFTTDNPNPPFDVAAVGERYRQAPLKFHFLYVKPKGDSTTGDVFEESGDLYAAFRRLAETTGGVSDTAAEPLAGLMTVAETLDRGD